MWEGRLFGLGVHCLKEHSPWVLIVRQLLYLKQHNAQVN